MQRAKAGITILLLIASAIIFSFFMEDKVKSKFMGTVSSEAEDTPGS